MNRRCLLHRYRKKRCEFLTAAACLVRCLCACRSLPRRLITPEEVVEVNSDASSSGDKDEVETSIGQASKSEKWVLSLMSPR